MAVSIPAGPGGKRASFPPGDGPRWGEAPCAISVQHGLKTPVPRAQPAISIKCGRSVAGLPAASYMAGMPEPANAIGYQLAILVNTNSRSGERVFSLSTAQCRDGVKRKRLTMMDTIEHDRGWQGVDRAERFAKPRAWEVHSDYWCASVPEKRTATARWGRAVLIIAALSTLSWAVVLLAAIWALSTH